MLIFDIEFSVNTRKIVDIGAITKKNKEFHNSNVGGFERFIKNNKPNFFAGHNVINFDLMHLQSYSLASYIPRSKTIDTLFLSTLLFPKKPYHNLIKDDKIISDHVNNPFNDAKKALFLLDDSVNEFNKLDEGLQNIYYYLLKNINGFKAFFEYIKFKSKIKNIENLIYSRFERDICANKEINKYIKESPIELAYALAYINTKDTSNSLLPAWILNNYSEVENILLKLRSTPCGITDCYFCNKSLSGKKGLKRFFNYDSFRTFEGVSLQEDAVKSALKNESLIAVFPTGGGKSLTFQLPALISGENIGGLTVVISPLLSLMKDQIDNLYEKGITNVSFINSLLNPIERKDVIDRVLDGSVNLLYLAPEALRSRTIERILLKRQVVRFVIDEAHCFSSWGHDFRVDYLYIGDFIKNLMITKEIETPIPISCFTATAKVNVINDIKEYFKDKLNLNMSLFKTSKGRTNLEYEVINIDEEDNRYLKLRGLIESYDTPTIIYASRIKTIDNLYTRLNQDNFNVSKFHGKMNPDDKIQNQNNFKNNDTKIMVATNAFGMGVDKGDIGLIVHYDISSSLENYIQESGRAGRDEKLKAKCYILYNENDLDKHFDLLNFSKVSIKEISQMWKGIKEKTILNKQLTKSALELSKIAGWQEEMQNSAERVATSVAALENSKFIKRGLNAPRIYATSLLVNNMDEASTKIRESSLDEKQKLICTRIVLSLISNKRKTLSAEAESRVDYLADILGLEKHTVIEHINYLRELRILEDGNDLYAKINKHTKINTMNVSLNRFKEHLFYLLSSFAETRKPFNLKQLNDNFKDSNYKPNLKVLRNALNYLEITKAIKIDKSHNENFYANIIEEKELILTKLDKFFKISFFIINYLFDKFFNYNELNLTTYIDFSIIELKTKYLESLGFIKENVSLKDVEKSILLIERSGSLSFEGGFLVFYAPYTITNLITDKHKRYTKDNYQKLNAFYTNKKQQIHIIGRYAELMNENKEDANELVSDYFNLEYNTFLDKHFPGQLKKELDLSMSKIRYNKLFGKLSQEQKEIIDDGKSKIIGVTAGPGSGKTTLLVHKLASIIFFEDVKTEQLLMLTFSRNAANEFKERLKELIGDVAKYINITTFHSFAFDILGKYGSLEFSDNVIKEAVELLRNNEADSFKITKTMLVIDEAQDISLNEYQIVEELIKFNEDLRVLAVGDDDQNIFEFRGSNSEFLGKFTGEKKYELSINFRSSRTIVDYTNRVIDINKNRLKTKIIKPLTSDPGLVSIFTYNKTNLITPVVNKIIKDNLPGTTAIITKRNEEALLISGLLNEYKVENKLIQDFKDVKMFNMYEARIFYEFLTKTTPDKIDKPLWLTALRRYEEKYKDSTHFDSIINTFNKFYELYEEPYLSDFKEYLLEMGVEYSNNNKKLIVANIHKVKGMEFDNVYLLYDNQSYLNEEEIREVYVAMTRAKSFLEIHTTNKLFKNMHVINVRNKDYDIIYEEPVVIELIFNLTDVNLGYSEFVQDNLNNLMSGDELQLNEGYIISNNKKVGRLSKKAYEIIIQRKEKGYVVEHLEIANLVYWYNKEIEKEILVLLPKIKFRMTDKSLLDNKEVL